MDIWKDKEGQTHVEFRDENDRTACVSESLVHPVCVRVGLEVMQNPKMLLTQEQVAEILPYLQRFVETGRLEG
jgi:hypothetical protein